MGFGLGVKSIVTELLLVSSLFMTSSFFVYTQVNHVLYRTNITYTASRLIHNFS